MTARRLAMATVLCSVATALALVGVEASASPPTALTKPKSPITKFPQSGGPNVGSGMTRVGHKVYFLTTNAAGRSTLNRIGPNGHVKQAKLPGNAYGFLAPAKTSDGGIWVTVEPLSGASDLGIRAAGLNPATGTVRTAGSKAVALSGWQSAVDGNGRYWSQGNIPGKGIGLLGYGLSGRKVSVRTNVGPISDSTDVNLNNPLAKGPDGRVWLLGGDRFSARLRIASFSAKGIRKDFTPKGLSVGALAWTRAGGKLWTLAPREDGRIAAVGVISDAPYARVPTTLYAECQLPAVVPVGDGNGGLWFTGTDSACNHTGQLILGKVDMRQGVASAHQTGLTVLDASASTVVPVGNGVLAAGLTVSGKLAFARVAGTTSTMTTNVEPYLDETQSAYPLVSDERNGAWAQAVNAKGNLVVVHVTGTTKTKTGTGLEPIAREIAVGPDKSLWTQGLRGNELVIVKVRPNGSMKKYPTGLAPTQFVLGPTYDGDDHLYFQAVKPTTGQLVLVRVPTG